MSIIRIKGDEIEFEGSLDDIKKELSRKFACREVSGGKIAKELDVTIKTLYNWAHKYDTYMPMGNRKYSIIQKIKLVLLYDSLNIDEKGSFLRKKEIYDEDILNWKSEITNLEDLPKKKQSGEEEIRLIRSDLKRTKKMLNEKSNIIRKKEKELKEAKAIIELKKKAEILFGADDEE